MKTLSAFFLLGLTTSAFAQVPVSKEAFTFSSSQNVKTEQCAVERVNILGQLIQIYTATAVGPEDADLKVDACNTAMSDCVQEETEDQLCKIAE
ncbi:MAG: hypothetical protein ACXVCY_12355 [Pseudobdellovibrionaceae bacterium]